MEQPKITCVACSCEINGGHYNTPDGRYCTKCWAKVPISRKRHLEEELIRKMSTPPRFI